MCNVLPLVRTGHAICLHANGSKKYIFLFCPRIKLTICHCAKLMTTNYTRLVMRQNDHQLVLQVCLENQLWSGTRWDLAAAGIRSAPRRCFWLASPGVTGVVYPLTTSAPATDDRWLLVSVNGWWNHRMVEVGRVLCGSSSPNPLPKEGRLQQAAQDLVQAGLEYLQRRRLHNLPGQPVPGLRHPQSEEVLPHIQTELPMLQFC